MRALAGDGVDIWYETFGRPLRPSGPTGPAPVLLIPGLAADRRIWAGQRLALGRRHACLAMDNRGAGRSAKPPGPYSLAQMADDALSVLDAAGVERAHVIGHSMGSSVAQVLAARHPERVRSLVLSCAAARQQPWRRELLARWRDVAARRGSHVWAREAFGWLVGPRTARVFGLWINLAWPIILTLPGDALAAQLDALLAAEDDSTPGAVEARLAAISAPTLVLCGALDRLTPPSDGAEIAAWVAGARQHVIPGAGHGLMIEAAPEFNEAVLGFLAAVESSLPRLAGSPALIPGGSPGSGWY